MKAMEENNTYYQQPNNAYVNPEHTLKQSKQEQTHEKNILSEKNKHELEIIDKNNNHILEIKKKELGWFGIFFGGKELISLNISGMLIIFLLITGLLLSYKIYNDKTDLDSVVKIWGIITPIITLTLGYIFGSKNNSNNC